MRMASQQLLAPQFDDPREIVSWMGPMQAQDYNYFRWALGIRQQNPWLKDVREAFDRGALFRLHLCRCTVHVVTHEDIHRLLPLYREQNLRTTMSWGKALNITVSEEEHAEVLEAMKEILAGHSSLTREQIRQELLAQGFRAERKSMVQYIYRAEIEGVICSGMMTGRHQSWMLLGDHVAKSREYSQEETLALLAMKYFRSHSPASFDDFCWYTGLPKRQNRKAMELIAPELQEVKIGETVMFVHRDARVSAGLERQVALLSPYDEYLIGYKSRYISLDKKFKARAHNDNGIFHPVVLYEGRVVGNWHSSIDKGGEKIVVEIFTRKREVTQKRLESGMHRFREFCK